MAIVECWFDYSSPFAYLGTTQIERVAEGAGGEVRFRPFLLGALFKTIGTPLVPLASFPRPKRDYLALELDRWAAWWGVPFRFNTHFPLRTVSALRLTLLADSSPALIHRLMKAAWVDDEDLEDPEVLRRCLSEASVDVGLLERVGEAKGALREATDEAVERGLPGAPCFVVGPHLYWGQDRLDFVKAALEGSPPGTDEGSGPT